MTPLFREVGVECSMSGFADGDGRGNGGGSKLDSDGVRSGNALGSSLDEGWVYRFFGPRDKARKVSR